MQFFKCANGKLVNPSLVTSCYYRRVENKYIAVFQHPGGSCTEVTFDRETSAEREIERFVNTAARTTRV